MRVLGQFYFFYEKISHAQKSTKTHISEQKQKKAVLNVLKKRLRGRKLPIRLFRFLCSSCAFCAFSAF